MYFSPHLAYFITGHGYGHGVRSCAIINALPLSTQITIISSLPREFFQREISRPFHLISQAIDCGCVQQDTVYIDKQATLATYAQINAQRETLITEYATLLQKLAVTLVIADIAPLAFPIAHRAKIPAFAITNFNWWDIYQPFLTDYPQYQHLLQQIATDYALATCALCLSPSLPMQVFPTRHEVGILFRQGAVKRAVIAQRLGLNPAKKWVLVYIGNYGLAGVQWEKLAAFNEFEFFGIEPLENAPANYHLIPADKVGLAYADFTASADVILGKLGYGLVSECLGLGKPVLFLKREDFAEYDCLKQRLLKTQQGIEITETQLRELAILEALQTLCARDYSPVTQNALDEIIQLINQAHKVI
ncbi:glycosyltransferase family protein [Beggiatoa alba]|nr:glycosyltransferase family protein [Beggiatoa alba]